MGRHMGSCSRKELLRAIADRYGTAVRREKGRILDEFVAVTGYHRKHALRLLRVQVATGGDAVERAHAKRIYGEAVRGGLHVLWEASDRICGKRLKAILPFLVEAMERHGHLNLADDVRAGLIAMSASTIDRILTPARVQAGGSRRPRLGSRSAVSRQIAVRTFADWNDPAPGFFEVDFVAHCGGVMSGRFIHTLTLTDIATGWTECIALVAREQSLVRQAFLVVAERLPMKLKGIDTDNDGAFINDTVFNHCVQEGIEFTRSRARRKNDQAWVEQKNGAVVRRLVGHSRFEGPADAQLLSELFRAARLYVNFFQPSFKLLQKVRIGSKIRKQYSPPATPCERLIAHPSTSDRTRIELREQCAALDPVLLLKTIRDAQASLAATSERKDTSATEIAPARSIAAFLAQLPDLWREGEARPTHRSKPRPARTWRTRKDPFDSVWSTVLGWLASEPDATAKEVFDRLQTTHNEAFSRGQLRTLQRRLKEWRREMARELLFGAQLPEGRPSVATASSATS